jgi:hypothetical protein
MSEEQNKNTSYEKLIPLTEWPKYYSWPPIGGLRHLVFHEKTNGFNKVIRRCGKRILINVDSFFAWVETNNRKGG